MQDRAALLILINNHFDLTWKRCFTRRIHEHGMTHFSYEEMHVNYINDNLQLTRANPGYKFHIESTHVVRHFLENHPEYLAELRELAQHGRLMIKGAGDNIIDSNLVHGESIVRNFVDGLLWVEETFGVATMMATRADGFGNSAQLPQILRGCELTWLPEISYFTSPKPYWYGLDGSGVYVGGHPRVGGPGPGEGHVVPCAPCRGRGCDVCAGRGIPPERVVPLPEWLNEDTLREHGMGVVTFGSEEPMVNPAIIDWAARYAERYDVRFAVMSDPLLVPHDAITHTDDATPDEVYHGELNPTDSGVLVTRIRTKQTCRRQEYAMLNTESLAVMAMLAGARYPQTVIRAIWSDMHFTHFHDAVTGTLTDAPYRELLEVWTQIDGKVSRLQTKLLGTLTTPDANTVSVINPRNGSSTQSVNVVVDGVLDGAVVTDELGNAAAVLSTATEPAQGTTTVRFVASEVPSMGVRHYRVTPAAQAAACRLSATPVIENSRFRVTADEHGITAIFDKLLQREVSCSGQYRPAELIAERDFGSPWSTHSPDKARTPLSAQTALLRTEIDAHEQRLIFSNPPSKRQMSFHGFAIDGLNCTTTVTLTDGIDRVDFRTEVFWDTYGLRLRVAMPVPAHGEHLYEIPYGVMNRKPYTQTYEQPPVGGWHTGDGDWPTANWAGVETEDFSVALCNKGLPSYRIETGYGEETILLSLLRSAVLPTHLACPQNFTTDFDGMRDTGTHVFEYALTAYDSSFATSAVADDAENYNAGLLARAGKVTLPAMPTVTSTGAVRLAALKWAESGRAIIMRLVERGGQTSVAAVHLPAFANRIARVNLLEREEQLLQINADSVSLTLHPWEIATLRIEVGEMI